VEELFVYPVKRLFGDTRAIVLCPAPYLGIEHLDQCRLRCAFVLANHLAHFLQVSLASFLAGFDERLEARSSSMRAGTVSSDLVLPHVEAEKVKAHVSLKLIECVGYAGLAGFQP
jgi:hypothetical protein